MFSWIHFKSFSVILFTMLPVVQSGFSLSFFFPFDPELIATRMFCLEQIPVPVLPGTSLVVQSGDPESPKHVAKG